MPSALLLSPETPFPTVGGGSMRTASVLHYLASRYDLHVITWRQPGAPDPRIAFPSNLHLDVIDLPYHSKSAAARALRNLVRGAQGMPPLIDRFRGFDAQLTALLRPPYDVAVVEHFWVAGYVQTLRPHVRRLVLDLHNIESTLLDRAAANEPLHTRLLFRRWSAACRALERSTVPAYDLVLTASATDSAQVEGPAAVVPNTIPLIPCPGPNIPRRPREIVFSGNMEYHPNLAAVRWFLRDIWPILRAADPAITVRFLGKNEHAITPVLRESPEPHRLHATGPVAEAVPALAESAAAIVPLNSGSGTRIKIIEAWAAALPVVSTTVGAEGLPGRPGEHLLLADTPADFAAAIVKVLQNPGESRRLGSNGRRLYESELTWEAAWKALSQAGL